MAETYTCQSCRQHDECQAEYGTSGPTSTGCADWKEASTADQTARADDVVTQMDREAAAELAEWLTQAQVNWKGQEIWFMPHFPGEVRKGTWDNHPWVQSFARHRIASTEALRKALTWIADNCENGMINHVDFRVEAKHRADDALQGTA